jgi:hypothetical protein
MTRHSPAAVSTWVALAAVGTWLGARVMRARSTRSEVSDETRKSARAAFEESLHEQLCEWVDAFLSTRRFAAERRASMRARSTSDADSREDANAGLDELASPQLAIDFAAAYGGDVSRLLLRPLRAVLDEQYLEASAARWRDDPRSFLLDVMLEESW